MTTSGPCARKEFPRPPKVSANGAIIHKLKKGNPRVYLRDMNINSLNFPYGSGITKGASLFNDLLCPKAIKVVFFYDTTIQKFFFTAEF